MSWCFCSILCVQYKLQACIVVKFIHSHCYLVFYSMTTSNVYLFYNWWMFRLFPGFVCYSGAAKNVLYVSLSECIYKFCGVCTQVCSCWVYWHSGVMDTARLTSEVIRIRMYVPTYEKKSYFIYLLVIGTSLSVLHPF